MGLVLQPKDDFGSGPEPIVPRIPPTADELEAEADHLEAAMATEQGDTRKAAVKAIADAKREQAARMRETKP